MPKTKVKNFESSLKLIVRTSFFVFIGVILSKLIGYAYRIIVARYYGPETYGVFLLALLVISLAGIFASFGLGDGILRYAAIYRGKKEMPKIKQLLKTSIAFSAITGIIAAGLIFVFAEFISINLFHSTELVNYIKYFSILVPLSLVLGIYLSVLRAFEKVTVFSFIFNIAQNVSRIGILVLLILIGIKTNAVIFSYGLSIVTIFLLSYFLTRRYVPEIFLKTKAKYDKSIFSKVYSYSWPLMFSAVLSSILYWIDTFSIGIYKTPTEVGIYNAAVPIALLMTLFSEIFMQLFLPLITFNYAKKNNKLIDQLSKQVSKWIFAINLPALLLILIFPGAILNILFGAQYLDAQNSLRLLAIGAFFFSIASVSSSLMSMAGKSKAILVNTIIACVLNLALNTLLVPKYGITGAAFATMVSFIILSLLYVIQARRHTKVIPFRRKMLNIVFSAAISFAILLFLRNLIEKTLMGLALITLLFLLTYALMILLTKSLDENDTNIIRVIKNKIRIR